MKVVIVSKFNTPRLSYIGDWLSQQWNLTVSIQSVATDGAINIAYDNATNHECNLSIPNIGLLGQNDISNKNIEVGTFHDLHYLFEIKISDADIPFDFFSMVFYLLSRYEEYLYHKKDQHGRWESRQSIAVQHDFISSPIIDLWLLRLQKIIEKRHPHRFRPKSYNIKPTIDIDLPYAYKTKAWRNIAGLLRDALYGDKIKVQARLNFLKNGLDPFDSYDYLLDTLSTYEETIFFFLCRYEGLYDENFLIDHSLFQTVVQKINDHFRIGVHPSYSSNEQSEYVEEELAILTNLCKKPIVKSRQHFLKLTIPDTYRRLIDIGILEDHSLMYPDQIGFRASTSQPFYWYDLQSESATKLLIHNPCIMDVTMKNYHNWTPDKAQQEISKIKRTLTQSGGNLEFIWHNSSFSAAHGWHGWKEVFEYLLED